MLVEVVEMLDGQVAEGALPAGLGVVLTGRRRVTSHGCHIPAQLPGAVDQRVDGVVCGGCGAGRSANRWDGISYSDTGAVRPGLRGGRYRLSHSPRRPVRHSTTLIM